MNNSVTHSASPLANNSASAFAHALEVARGGQSDIQSPQLDGSTDQTYQENQQKIQSEKMRRERMQQLMREVAPVEQHDVFVAGEMKVQREIDNIRAELQVLVQQVPDAPLETEKTVNTNVSKPGLDGAYFLRFFKRVGSRLEWMREEVTKGQPWATTVDSKKRKQSSAPGMQISGRSYEQTKTVHKLAHHELSTAYAGS